MSEPVFSGYYSYRRPAVLIVGTVMFVATGIFLATLASSAILKPPQGKDILAGLFAVGIVGTLFFVGGYLLWAFFRRHRLLIEIGDEGVQYGGKFVPWERVRWISGIAYRGRYQLKLARRGFASDLHLTTDAGFSEEEYKKLMSALEHRLADRFPDLSVG